MTFPSSTTTTTFLLCWQHQSLFLTPRTTLHTETLFTIQSVPEGYNCILWFQNVGSFFKEINTFI